METPFNLDHLACLFFTTFSKLTKLKYFSFCTGFFATIVNGLVNLKLFQVRNIDIFFIFLACLQALQKNQVSSTFKDYPKKICPPPCPNPLLKLLVTPPDKRNLSSQTKVVNINRLEYNCTRLYVAFRETVISKINGILPSYGQM